jgi:subtilisin family serine protease
MRSILSLFLVVIILLTGCTRLKEEGLPEQSKEVGTNMEDTQKTPDITQQKSIENIKTVKPYDDIRYFDWVDGRKSTYEESEYNKEDIFTFRFNKETVLKGNEDYQAQIMENGKNPGLGIRDIHKQGITGKGINVAIIDQNLLLNHPEFAGKVVAYYDTGCEVGEDEGSMHAPAVTSILVGNEIGVAPDAKVYFAAAPSWTGDSEFYAKGLYWIIEENKKLPVGEKIRVVSVSAAPSGNGTPFTKNLEKWDEAVLAAQNDGILVLDCRMNKETGFIAPAYYDPEDPDDISKCKGGFPTSKNKYIVPKTEIGVPTSYRTVAEEYTEGTPSYQYTGQGGLSWGIPYAAGVLALGWQINPDLDKDQIVKILFDTCSKSNDGSNIINPPAFIDAIQKLK